VQIQDGADVRFRNARELEQFAQVFADVERRSGSLCCCVCR
jgi:hypothetical protein